MKKNCTECGQAFEVEAGSKWKDVDICITCVVRREMKKLGESLIPPGKTKEEVINLAINSTVSRTVITSLTTLFVVAILLFFGGASIRGFAFALFVGIIVGTYSSIFIATTIMSDLTGDITMKKAKASKSSFSKAAASE